MKIILLSMFSVPTGHVKVAEVLQENIKSSHPDAEVKIIDFLSFSNQFLENAVSGFYMKWIKAYPESYKSFYSQLMMSDDYTGVLKSLSMCSVYFEMKLKKLVEEEKPSHIICTHSFPSRIIGRLKKKSPVFDPATFNVYTDFFINGVWDKENIDFHLVPSKETKQELINEYTIPSDRIYTTGVPVSDVFKEAKCKSSKSETDQKHLLIAGGNNGLCVLKEFMVDPSHACNYTYTVLCGHNKKLFDMLSTKPNIKPLMYIEDREALNEIYESVDAIITKPGGVTITEALHKRIPIFIHDFLPGQEEINLEFLKEKKLVYLLNSDHPMEIISSILNDEREMSDHLVRIHQYLTSISTSVDEALSALLNINRGQLIQPSINQQGVSKTLLN
ncbi:UDP-N-acetylglucosamine--LPS N-acetylglucosamine transferase [Bacillus haikouensis]|uniref:MGDG synthase family glycosyltransferase n=1 Tax=Bacillus haikouensis TaxID=1510468 RepID=UPI001556CC48|nr:UDP-N-acetylglucosamine--LPS N-acetylglucosamine transferase [Bacillus haikouensis]NQD64497.1 UDP-N-acetylglucosamine--LPS N-acetylglucosamine transferase [Bacillus haikouensis]